MIPLQAAVDGVEVAVGLKDQILAVRTEDGRRGVIPFLRHGVFFLRAQVVDIHHGEIVGRGLGVSNPAAVRREGHIVKLLFGILHHHGLCLGSYVHGDDAVLAVGVKHCLAVRAPAEIADVGVAARGQLNGVASLGGLQVDFRLSRAVGDVGNVVAVGTPIRAAFIGTGGAGDVARHTALGRHIEYLAAGGHGQTFAIGTEACGSDIVGYLLALGAGVDILGVQRDVYLFCLARLGVEAVEVAAVLVNDLLAVRAGELDVIIGIVGHLLRLLGASVVDEEVHRLVAVGDKVDVVANPHGADILRHVVRQVNHFLGLRVVEPDVVRHAAPVVLPVAELTEDAVVGQLLAIRRVTAKAAFGQGQCLGHTAIDRCHPELSLKSVADAVAEDDVLSVCRPGHHDVVGSHAVAHIVAGIGRRIGQAARLATVGGHHVDFAVAVILARKGDGLTVRREAGKQFITDV